MKTINFVADDTNNYTIFVNQITCIYPSKQQGTWLRLSCGKEVLTMINFNTLLKMINGEV